MRLRVLIWDTDVVWTEGLKRSLEMENMQYQEVDSVEEYKRLSYSSRYSACILSMEALKEQVTEVAEREETYWETVWERLEDLCMMSPLPVILMTEKQDDEQEIQAFRRGVSDYMVKGRNPLVCLARIQAVIRSRSFPVNQREELLLDKTSHQMLVGEERIRLTNREYSVLSYLYANFNRAVDRETLLEQVWNSKNEENKRVVDTVVKQLRRKLITTPYEICSVYKLGYQLQKRETIKYNFLPSVETEVHL